MLDTICAFLKKSTEIKGKRIPNKVIVSIIVAVVIALGVFLSVCKVHDRSGLFKNIAWGTNLNDVLNILMHDKEISDVLECEGEFKIIYKIENPEGKADISIGGVAFFDESSNLQEIGMIIMKEAGSQYSDDELIHELCYRFDNLYGDCTHDGVSYTWLTDKSEISFAYMSDGYFVLQYKEVNSEK